MDIWIINSSGLFLTLLALISTVLSKSLDSFNQEESSLSQRCFCHIKDIKTDDIIYDHGEIETYNMPTSYCHHAHQQCRAACREKLNLHAADDSGLPKRGYVYCDSYGQVTKKQALHLDAVWRVENCHANKDIESIKTVHLCCGHTSVNLNHNNIKVFGWNPDCRAQMFDLGKAKH